MGADDTIQKVLERVKIGPVEELQYWKEMIAWVEEYEAHEK